jgi:hypothetical protein
LTNLAGRENARIDFENAMAIYQNNKSQMTKNQRIVYLIEKYEKRGLSNITGKDITSEDDDDVMIFQEEEEKGEFSQRRMSHGNN